MGNKIVLHFGDHFQFFNLLLNFGLTYISVCCKLQVRYVWISKSLSLRALFPFYVVKAAETLVVLFSSVCESRLSSYNNSML